MTHGIGNEWDPGDPPEIHNEIKKEGIRAHENELTREHTPVGLLLRLIEAYRAGYSCGYADGAAGQRMRDKDAACAFYQIDGVPDIAAEEAL